MLEEFQEKANNIEMNSLNIENNCELIVEGIKNYHINVATVLNAPFPHVTQNKKEIQEKESNSIFEDIINEDSINNSKKEPTVSRKRPRNEFQISSGQLRRQSSESEKSQEEDDDDSDSFSSFAEIIKERVRDYDNDDSVDSQELSPQISHELTSDGDASSGSFDVGSHDSHSDDGHEGDDNRHRMGPKIRKKKEKLEC